MNKYKLKILVCLDRFIRFMGLVGGAVIAIIGLILGLWDDKVGSLIYSAIFIICWVYCLEYNGSEWAI